MADVYKVKSGSVNVYATAAAKKVVGTYKKGREVRVYSKSRNEHGDTFCNTAKNGAKWVNLAYLQKTTQGKASNKNRSATPSNTIDGAAITQKENMDKTKDDTIYGMSESSYKKLMLRYIRAFGSPPRYTEAVDPYYTEKNAGIYTGRAMSSTWFTDPAILSLAPGTVDYLPGFLGSKKKKNKFFNELKGSMSGEMLSLARKDNKSDLNGKLYEFKSAYRDYINVVNLLARTSANYLGIGNVTDLFYGTKVPLKKFDYGFYTTPSKAKSVSNIFDEIKQDLGTAVSDSSYIHFFVNHGNASAQESITTSAGESFLEQKLGDSSTFSSLSQNLQFLFGGAVTDKARTDIEGILSEARDNSEFVGGLTTIMSNYLKGGRLVFPKMITGMSYEKSLSVNLTFSSIYGDKRSIFKYTILPALHLLALATPKQLTNNMYTYPYLVRAYQRGNFNSDLAFINNLEITRGGSDDTCWTVDGLPTEITCSFNITPLYSNMMVTSARNPFLFMNNTALMEYLGTMCGLDLKCNNFAVKKKLALDLIKNYVHDTPTNAARHIVDSGIANTIRNFAQITN